MVVKDDCSKREDSDGRRLKDARGPGEAKDKPMEKKKKKIKHAQINFR